MISTFIWFTYLRTGTSGSTKIPSGTDKSHWEEIDDKWSGISTPINGLNKLVRFNGFGLTLFHLDIDKQFLLYPNGFLKFKIRKDSEPKKMGRQVKNVAVGGPGVFAIDGTDNELMFLQGSHQASTNYWEEIEFADVYWQM